MSSKVNSIHNAGMVANASNNNRVPPPTEQGMIAENDSSSSSSPREEKNPGEPPVVAIPIDSWAEPAISTSYTESSGSIASCNFIPIIAVAMVVVVTLCIAIITLELRFRAMSGGPDGCSSAEGGDCGGGGAF